MMTLSNTGQQLIKKFEGLRLHAYQDSAGVWTIGYGSTYYADGTAVKKGNRLADENEAGHLFMLTIDTYIKAVNRLIKVPVNQHQFDALVSLAYNIGTGAFAASTLLKLLNQSRHPAAADQFLKWNKITNPHTGLKEVNAGLAKRREQERALFLQP